MTQLIVEYNIGGSGPDIAKRHVRRIDPQTGWYGLALSELPIAQAGHPMWLHNIGGLGLQPVDPETDEDPDGEPMSPLQWLWAKRQGLDWLANDCAFSAAVTIWRLAGAPYVVPYLGSPDKVPWYLWRWFRKHCLWLVKLCGAIGFDATFDFPPDGKVDRLLRELRQKGLVFCEGRPIESQAHNRPPVVWVERLVAYQRRASDGGRRGRTGDTWASDGMIDQPQGILVQRRDDALALPGLGINLDTAPTEFLIVRRNHLDRARIEP